MKPEESIFFRLAKANQMAGRFWKTRLAPFKLTAVQGMVIVFLHEEDSLTATELGKRIRLDSATMTGVLARLEKAGLAQRRKDV
ncbi:MAG: MarR family transcriptional regulator, partial [Desulfosarcina sp.]|nr:MarR family transcriptional regulator [Desulfobacterales bacterium]